MSTWFQSTPRRHAPAHGGGIDRRGNTRLGPSRPARSCQKAKRSSVAGRGTRIRYNEVEAVRTATDRIHRRPARPQLASRTPVICDLQNAAWSRRPRSPGTVSTTRCDGLRRGGRPPSFALSKAARGRCVVVGRLIGPWQGPGASRKCVWLRKLCARLGSGEVIREIIGIKPSSALQFGTIFAPQVTCTISVGGAMDPR